MFMLKLILYPPMCFHFHFHFKYQRTQTRIQFAIVLWIVCVCVGLDSLTLLFTCNHPQQAAEHMHSRTNSSSLSHIGNAWLVYYLDGRFRTSRIFIAIVKFSHWNGSRAEDCVYTKFPTQSKHGSNMRARKSAFYSHTHTNTNTRVHTQKSKYQTDGREKSIHGE